MRILIAPDKYKGTLSAMEAARAMEKACRSELPDAEIIIQPIADGGEGSLEALQSNPAFTKQTCELEAANGKVLSIPFLQKGASAFLETASVIGLALPDLPPILERSTGGVGQWARLMFENQIYDLHFFLGGSSTSDGGFGFGQMLGLSFLDEDGRPVASFVDILRARQARFATLPARADFTFYCDVLSPIAGKSGAARLFASQKGATAPEVEWLEQALLHMQTLLKKANRQALENKPGSGAAGGLALPFAFWPELRCQIQKGAQFILQSTGLAGLLLRKEVDLVLTGEGCTDRGTLQGKAVHELVLQARATGTQIAVLSGSYKDIADLQGLPIFLHDAARPASKQEAGQSLTAITLQFIQSGGVSL
jgi:glycerate kinase